MYNFVHFEILIFVHFKFIIYIDEREDEEIKPEKPKKPAKVITDSRSHSTAQDGQE